jgi:hypothetical protein
MERTTTALEMLIDARLRGEVRLQAATELELDPTAYYRVVAMPASSETEGPSSVVSTPVGSVRFTVRDLAAPLPLTRSGVGLAVVPDSLDRSWASALIALRLTSRDAPVQRADQLGALLVVAEAADAASGDHADLASLKFLLRSQPKALRVLEVLARAASVRRAADASGLHPDAIRERAQEYLRALGFDVLTSNGRVRLTVALALFRLQTNRFE